MKNTIIKFLPALCLLAITHFAQAQGCSDAGFCTLSSFKPNASDSVAETKNRLKIGGSFGQADYDISVSGAYLEYGRQLNSKFGVDAKLSSLGQSGNEISVFGLSDLYVNANYKFSRKGSLTLGAKIPLMQGDRTQNGIALPMDYQSSLGTFDLIVGMGYEVKKIQFMLGLQQPLTQNDNAFLASNILQYPALDSFQLTNKFIRRGDVLLRVSYPIMLGKKFTITPGLLPIYHLGEDKYTDKLGIERNIKGSDGLTLNGNLYFDYAIDNRNALQLNLGAPFIVRDARPDGLTRSFVLNLEYSVRF